MLTTDTMRSSSSSSSGVSSSDHSASSSNQPLCPSSTSSVSTAAVAPQPRTRLDANHSQPDGDPNAHKNDHPEILWDKFILGVLLSMKYHLENTPRYPQVLLNQDQSISFFVETQGDEPDFGKNPELYSELSEAYKFRNVLQNDDIQKLLESHSKEMSLSVINNGRVVEKKYDSKIDVMEYKINLQLEDFDAILKRHSGYAYRENLSVLQLQKQFKLKPGIIRLFPVIPLDDSHLVVRSVDCQSPEMISLQLLKLLPDNHGIPNRFHWALPEVSSRLHIEQARANDIVNELLKRNGMLIERMCVQGDEGRTIRRPSSNPAGIFPVTVVDIDEETKNFYLLYGNTGADELAYCKSVEVSAIDFLQIALEYVDRDFAHSKNTIGIEKQREVIKNICTIMLQEIDQKIATITDQAQQYGSTRSTCLSASDSSDSSKLENANGVSSGSITSTSASATNLSLNENEKRKLLELKVGIRKRLDALELAIEKERKADPQSQTTPTDLKGEAKEGVKVDSIQSRGGSGLYPSISSSISSVTTTISQANHSMDGTDMDDNANHHKNNQKLTGEDVRRLVNPILERDGASEAKMTESLSQIIQGCNIEPFTIVLMACAANAKHNPKARECIIREGVKRFPDLPSTFIGKALGFPSASAQKTDRPMSDAQESKEAKQTNQPSNGNSQASASSSSSSSNQSGISLADLLRSIGIPDSTSSPASDSSRSVSSNSSNFFSSSSVPSLSSSAPGAVSPSLPRSQPS